MIKLRDMSGVAAALCLAACANLFGPSPAEEVQAALDRFHTAEKSGDLETVLDTFSDDFSNSLGATKPILRGFFAPLIAQGVLQQMTIDDTKAVIDVDGDSATVTPVTYTTGMGAMSYVYTFRKEADGNWRIIQSETI